MQETQIVAISPEALEVANCYLQTTSVEDTARRMGMQKQAVSQYLQKREVKTYIDQVYMDQGYRNRFTLASTLDKVIEAKLEEMDETEMGSNKDIADLLALAHKFRMDEVKAATEQTKASAATVKNQTNVQINDSGFGKGNYGNLMKKLLTSE